MPRQSYNPSSLGIFLPSSPHICPCSCITHYPHLSRWCREVVCWGKSGLKWGGEGMRASYCMSSSFLAEGKHTASCPHMADFLEDSDSLFWKHSCPKNSLGHTPGCFHTSFQSMEHGGCSMSRMEHPQRAQLHCKCSKPDSWQTLGTAQQTVDGSFCTLPTEISPPSKQQTGKLSAQRCMKHIALTFKISCSCFKTAWTSSCNSHLNSSSYIVERQQQKH